MQPQHKALAHLFLIETECLELSLDLLDGTDHRHSVDCRHYGLLDDLPRHCRRKRFSERLCKLLNLGFGAALIGDSFLFDSKTSKLSLNAKLRFLPLNNTGVDIRWRVARQDVYLGRTLFVTTESSEVLQTVAGTVLVNWKMADEVLWISAS